MATILGFTHHIILQLCKKFRNPIGDLICLIGYEVVIATIYGTEGQKKGVRLPAAEHFPLFHSNRTDSGAHKRRIQWVTAALSLGQSIRSVKLTTLLHQVPKLLHVVVLN
jgi:hypothetical protein